MIGSQIQKTSRQYVYRDPAILADPISLSRECTFHQVDDEVGYILSDFDTHKIEGKSLISFCDRVSKRELRKTTEYNPLFHFHLQKIYPFLRTKLESGSNSIVLPLLAVEPACSSKLVRSSGATRSDVVCIASPLSPWLIKYLSAITDQVIVVMPFGRYPIAFSTLPTTKDEILHMLNRIGENFPTDKSIAELTRRSPIRSRAIIVEQENLEKLIDLARQLDTAKAQIVSYHVVSRVFRVHEYVTPMAGEVLATRLNEFSASSPVWIDGGNRAIAAPVLIKILEPLLSPLVGLVPEPIKVSEGGAPVYISSQVFPSAAALKSNRALGHRLAAAGKGESEEQAIASCIGEAIERYSACYQGTESGRVAAGSALEPVMN